MHHRFESYKSMGSADITARRMIVANSFLWFGRPWWSESGTAPRRRVGNAIQGRLRAVLSRFIEVPDATPYGAGWEKP
jgi:hypothetical protein